MDTRQPILVALGGNALVRKGHTGTYSEQLGNLARIAPTLAALARRHRLILTHGNGPQVGLLYLQQEHTPPGLPRLPLHACVAMTQSLIGYMIQQAASAADPGLETAVITTRVLVDPSDPAFTKPTKPIGPYYTRQEAARLAREKGWKMVHIPGKGWRRAVPSPKPLKVLEAPLISATARPGRLTVALGGGGIPVVRDTEGYRGVDAVVDKDLASSLLATTLGVATLVIATDVPGVYMDYGTPQARLLDELCAHEALKLAQQGYFPPGSMGPKVEAAARYALATGNTAVIGHLDHLADLVSMRRGTLIKPCHK